MTMAAPLDQMKACQAIKESAKRLACLDAATKQLTDSAPSQADKEAADARAALKAEAEVALVALNRLATKVYVGVGYADFVREVSEAKMIVDSFFEKKGPMEFFECKNEARLAMESYTEAAQLWSQRISTRRDQETERDSTVRWVINKYPALMKDFNTEGGYLVYNNAIPYLWGSAAKNVKNAERLFNAYFPK